MASDAHFYDRAPSEQLRTLLTPGGFLAPLTDLNERKVAGLELDVHLRTNDEVHVYCGLTRLMNIRRNTNGTVRVSAHTTFSRQECAQRLLRQWKGSESHEFEAALGAYLCRVKIDPRHTAGEGEVQSLWSRVTESWIPFDREAVLGGRGREPEKVKAAHTELEDIAHSQSKSSRQRDRWSKPPERGREIDQLAVDPDGRLVVLELKDASAGSSSVYYTPFQLLQYVWEWHDALECVRGRLQDLIDARVALGLTPGSVPRLTGGIRAAVCFGGDTRTDEVRRRYDRVLEVANRHLPPCVPRIETWALEHRPEPVRVVDSQPKSDPHRRPSSFANSLQAHLEEWRVGVDGSRDRIWPGWTDGIYPEYRQTAEEAVRDDEVRLHTYADHVRSSQAFAFNLFLPFREGNRSKLSDLVSETVGERLSIEEVRFEWVPPGALLGEVAGDRPSGDEPATAVDVVLWGRLAGGDRAAVLLEVKLSETDFTHCQGRTSKGNRRTDVCKSASLFFDEPSACYLRRPVRSGRDRRYWEIFAEGHDSVRAAFPGADLEGQCPFAYSMQQPMRNLAIARGLELGSDSEVDRAWFALCAHDNNPDVAVHWETWQRLLPNPSMAPKLPASQVVRAGESEGFTEWATWMRDRYRL